MPERKKGVGKGLTENEMKTRPSNSVTFSNRAALTAALDVLRGRAHKFRGEEGLVHRHALPPRPRGSLTSAVRGSERLFKLREKALVLAVTRTTTHTRTPQVHRRGGGLALHDYCTIARCIAGGASARIVMARTG